MKIAKIFSALLMVAVMAFSLVGCGDDDSSGSKFDSFKNDSNKNKYSTTYYDDYYDEYDDYYDEYDDYYDEYDEYYDEYLDEYEDYYDEYLDEYEDYYEDYLDDYMDYYDYY